MNLPRFRDARHVDSYFIGTLLAVLFTECETIDGVDYEHVLYVYQPDPRKPPAPGESPPCVMMISAAANDDPVEGSHMLSIHNGEIEHVAASDQWADLETFTEKALNLVKEHFEVDRDPVLLPMRKHPGYDDA